MLLAGAIAGDKIDRLAETKYKATGSWDNPLIERIGKKQDSDEQGQEQKEEKTDSHGLPVFE